MTLYGRAASKDEAREIRRTGRLPGSDGYVPTFDCPPYLAERLGGMSPDALHTYFGRIGVRNAAAVVLFTAGSVAGAVGPVPQSNGLREMKFPVGTPVDVLRTIRM